MRNTKQKNNQNITIQAGVVRVTSVGWMINMAALLMNQSMRETLEPLGASVDQFKVLMTLTEHDGLSQVAIGNKIGLPSYAMTRLLDSMENSGLVERHPDEKSRRCICIRLSRKGKALAPKLFKAVTTVNQEVLDPLSAKEKQQLSQLLEKIIPNDAKKSNEVRPK